MLTNCPSKDEAEQIADQLLQQNLASAVQTIGPTESRYRWQGEIHRQQEWLLIIKTQDRVEAQVNTTITAFHSYELPGILRVDITGGNAHYLAWILANSSG
ncbi:MAG: divalent-cation tolerance protein CutA [Chloroflexota bacterium]